MFEMLSRRRKRIDKDKLEANTWRGLNTYSEAPKCVDCCVRAGKQTIFDALSPWFFCRQLTKSMPRPTSMMSYKSCWFALRRTKNEERPSRSGDVPTEKRHLRRWKYKATQDRRGGQGSNPFGTWDSTFCRYNILNLNSILSTEYLIILAYINFRLAMPFTHWTFCHTTVCKARNIVFLLTF